MKTRYRKRTIEFERLDSKVLSAVSKLSAGQDYNLRWECEKDISLKLSGWRDQSGFCVYKRKCLTAYRINIIYQDTGFGQRPLWVCPNGYCSERCLKLFYSWKQDIFLCRQCIHVSYVSQNDSKADYLSHKIISLREELWGKDSIYLKYGDGLMESCDDWEKPKWMKWPKFIIKRSKIIELEMAYWSLIPKTTLPL